MARLKKFFFNPITAKLDLTDYPNDFSENTGSITDIGVTGGMANFGTCAAISGKYAYVADTGGGFGNLYIYDISDPNNVLLMQAFAMGSSNATDMDTDGSYVYIANSTTRLLIIDVRNIDAPVTVFNGTAWNVQRLKLDGKYLYVSRSSTNTVRVLDITDPASPVSFQLITVTNANRSAISGNVYATFSATGASVRTIYFYDITDSKAWVAYSTIVLASGNTPSDISISGRYCYVSCTQGTLVVIDIQNLTSPVVASTTTITTSASQTRIFVGARFLYYASFNASVSVVDIINPFVPVIVTTQSGILSNPMNMVVTGTVAYVVEFSGVRVIDMSGRESCGMRVNSLDVGNMNISGRVNSRSDLFQSGSSYFGAPVRFNNDISVRRNITSKGSLNLNRTAVAATPYAVLDTDFYIGVNVAAASAVNLPSSATAITGKVYIIKDESGAAAANNITVNRAGADTIDGAVAVVINANYGVLRIINNGAGAWFSI